MEQLTFLPELQELRGERKSARRAQRARTPREAGSWGAQPGQATFDFERAPGARRMARVVALPAADAARSRRRSPTRT